MTTVKIATLVTMLFATLWAKELTFAEEKLSVDILEEHTHDTGTFTQGLFWQKGVLYESSGLYRKSFLTRYNAKTGQTEQHLPLPQHFFAEGLTVYQHELYLLTWRAGKLLIFDSQNFKFKRQVDYKGQGWGLTHDGNQFLMSNGSEQIFFRDNQDFSIKKTITVHNKWRKYTKINELEFAEGAIWANVWQAPYILKISPVDGQVIAIASLDTLVKENSIRRGHSVLNGIAYDEERKAFWITGKLWPKRYLVRFQSDASSK